LRNSFKNFRKGCKKPSDDEKATDEPAAKRRRAESEDTIDATQEEYDDAVQQLKEEYKKKISKRGKQNPSEVKKLMTLTRKKRQQWIRADTPLVYDVISEFPYLESSLWVCFNS